MENPTTIITVIVAVTGLLTFVVQKGGGYLMRKNDEKDKQIAKLVEEFKETINHQRTKDREALEKLTTSINFVMEFLRNGKK